MKTTVEDISSVKKKLLVEIEASDVDKRINDAYKKVGRSAKIRGFRPGKVPLKILERYYGDKVLGEVTNDIIQETLPAAMQETETYPLNMPVIENEVLVKGRDYKYAAVMEVRPEFELKDYLGIEVEKEKCIIDDEDVEKQIASILKSRGNLVPMEEDRGLKDGDHAIIDYEGFDGAEAIDGLKGEKFSLEINKDNFYPGFCEKLIGEKKGNTKEFTLDFEEDYVNSRLAGKSIRFAVTVTDIKKLELPELNDEFVKGLGVEFDSVEALKKRIREDLTSREEKRVDNQLKNSLLEKIADTVDFELPESVVENEINSSMENISQNLMRSGTNFESMGLDQEKMKNDLRPAAEKNVKSAFVLGEIARQNDLDITEKDLSEGFEDVAKEAGQPVDIVRKYYEANNIVDAFRQTLLKEKTLKYLVENATVKEKEPDKKAEEK